MFERMTAGGTLLQDQGLISAAKSSTMTVDIYQLGCRIFLLQELRGPAVSQDLALGLAGGAVLQGSIGEGNLADSVSAHGARLTGPRMDAHVAPFDVLQVLSLIHI